VLGVRGNGFDIRKLVSHVTRREHDTAHLVNVHIDSTRVTQRSHFNAAAPNTAAGHLAAVLADTEAKSRREARCTVHAQYVCGR
jgi:hypothetical protein